MASSLRIDNSDAAPITSGGILSNIRSKLNELIKIEFIVVLIALALGFAVRLLSISSSDFPLGDGGMFFAMVRDLEANHFHIPAYTSFNHEHIPFAYPPLGFYLVAALNTWAGIGLLQLFRIVPLIVDTLCIAAFALLAHRILNSRMAWSAAVLVFGLLPESYYWQIKGGGVTRAMGMFFALMTLWRVTILLQEKNWRSVVPATIFAALSLATHPEWTWAAIIGSVVLWVAYGRSITSVLQGATVAVGTVILTSPWWLTVASYHGLSPYTEGHEWEHAGLHLRRGVGTALVFHARQYDVLLRRVGDRTGGGDAVHHSSPLAASGLALHLHHAGNAWRH